VCSLFNVHEYVSVTGCADTTESNGLYVINEDVDDCQFAGSNVGGSLLHNLSLQY